MKGQGAMDYLMTYGWALLIIVVVGVALYTLGVLNPETYQNPNQEYCDSLGEDCAWSSFQNCCDCNMEGETEVGNYTKICYRLPDDLDE